MSCADECPEGLAAGRCVGLPGDEREALGERGDLGEVGVFVAGPGGEGGCSAPAAARLWLTIHA